MSDKLTHIERREMREELERSASIDMVTSTEYTITIHFKKHAKVTRTKHYEEITGDKMDITHIDFENKRIEFTKVRD